MDSSGYDSEIMDLDTSGIKLSNRSIFYDTYTNLNKRKHVCYDEDKFYRRVTFKKQKTISAEEGQNYIELIKLARSMSGKVIYSVIDNYGWMFSFLNDLLRVTLGFETQDYRLVHPDTGIWEITLDCLYEGDKTTSKYLILQSIIDHIKKEKIEYCRNIGDMTKHLILLSELTDASSKFF